MKDVAIVGLPSSGKTTVFEAVARAHLGHGERKEHVAVLQVPDERVTTVAKLYGSAEATHAQVRLHDVPGLDARSLGLARAADGLACVLRAFGPDVDPARDLASLRAELALADVATVEHVAERAAKRAKAGDAHAKMELDVCERAAAVLEQGRWLCEEEWPGPHAQLIKLWTPLTIKPALNVVNADESEPALDAIPEPNVVIRAQLESEAADLAADEAAELLAAYGITQTASAEFVTAVYRALDLVTFFTANEREAHAWAVQKGSKAPQAAGAIHSDFERGFIRAERVTFDDLAAAGSPDAARHGGLVRVEGKDYEVREGDVLFIRHS